MTTIKELRKELIELRTFLVTQKAGLSSHKSYVNEGWYKYAIENSDKIREKINKMIEMLDAWIG
ncbi:hypothetical protein ES705_27411 [subsurface metagenome]